MREELEAAGPDPSRRVAIDEIQKVPALLDEEQQTLQIANDHGFRHFTSAEAFKRHAETEVLALASTDG